MSIKVTDRRQEHSLKTGGTGMRCTVRVGGSDTHLFYCDYHCARFVETKRMVGATSWDG